MDGEVNRISLHGNYEIIDDIPRWVFK